MTPHSTSAEEIADLLSIVERDLHDSAHEALRAHHRSIESLRLTVDLDASLARRLDAFRMRRNITEYDRAGVTSVDEAEEMRELAVTVCARVVGWLRAHHAGLIS